MRRHNGPKTNKSCHITYGYDGKKITRTTPNGIKQLSYQPGSIKRKASRIAGISKDSQARQIAIQKYKSSIHHEELAPTIQTKKQLLDFGRKTYESYYNRYEDGSMGNPICIRTKIKGIQFFEGDNKVAEVEVESVNEMNYITKFYVNSQYNGLGFAKELLRTANNSLTVNGVRLNKDDSESKIRFFENNDFTISKIDRQYIYLTRINNVKDNYIN